MDKKITVLIAEDEDYIREIYSTALTHEGMKVLEAKNGKEVLEYLEKMPDKINVILLDIVMPEMDGFELLEKVSKTPHSKIPIIVSTNLDNDEDKREALGLGADAYFVKSQHTPQELIDMVKQFSGIKA